MSWGNYDPGFPLDVFLFFSCWYTTNHWYSSKQSSTAWSLRIDSLKRQHLLSFTTISKCLSEV